MATKTSTGKTSKSAAKPARSSAAKPGAKVAKVAAKPAKAAVAKAPAKATTTRKAPAKTVAAAPKTARRPALTADQRLRYVEVAAYYIAERRGFAPGDTAADWLCAEVEIDRLLAEGKLNP